ncbi:2-dehydropantoate 2-reductase N-terminal domain-containing protein [Nonomuraea muscovyensis]|uniref:2-dehydropantoate 2-reductase N-terminal domain-containing protein n=1 Tax=Nonomuraea muscovyensis TaxID=1124761 RepID=UPI0033D87EBD
MALMKVLVVGAGALGQVFGMWLAAGGAQVSYLVRPGRQHWAAGGGAPVYRLRRRGGAVEQRLRPHQVVTEPAAGQSAGQWDMVWLCVDSTALPGPWTAGLRAATGGATVVTIGQAPQDHAVLTRTWPAEQIVQVRPALLAYPAPLPGERREPGIAYWVPPGSALGVSGTEPRARQVIDALRAGGARARRTRRAGAGDITAARMIPTIAALENAGWSIAATRYAGAARASREALAIAAAPHGRRAPLAAPAWAVALALRVLPLLVPFDLPRYLEAHFTKVSAQTRLMLDGWIAEGAARGLPVTHLRALRAEAAA